MSDTSGLYDILGPLGAVSLTDEKEDQKKPAVKMCAVGFDLTTDEHYVSVVPVDDLLVRPVKNIHEQFGTPSAISFDGGQRYTGKDAIDKEDCFRDVMKLIGKSFDQLKVERLSHLVNKNPQTNLLEVCAPGLPRFTPTHLLSMILSELKATAELNVGDVKKDYCIGIPVYFTQTQCLAVRQAAEIAGMDSVRLLNGSTAHGLKYGLIGCNYLQSAEELKVAIVDFGTHGCNVSIVDLRKKQVAVLSDAYDISISEGQMLTTLLDYFNKNAHLNHQRKKTWEKLTEKPLDENISDICRALIEHSKNTNRLQDPKPFMAQFSEITRPLLNKIDFLLEKALTQASLQKSEINKFIVTGTGYQICSIRQCLQDFFGKRGKEIECKNFVALADGCAFYCAMKSRNFKDRCDDEQWKKKKNHLLECNVANTREDKIWIDQDAAEEIWIDLDAAEAFNGRIRLTSNEIRAARHMESQLSLPKTLRDKISHLLTKLNEFATAEETSGLKDWLPTDAGELKEYFKSVLDGVDPSDRYQRLLESLLPVEKSIMARHYEHTNKEKVINALQLQITNSKKLVEAFHLRDIRYITITDEAINEFQKNIDETEEWLTTKKLEVRKRRKTQNPINFVQDARDKITYLVTTWLDKQLQRLPSIEVMKYSVLKDEFMEKLEELCKLLVKGNRHDPVTILGRRVLPLQTDYEGYPNTWIHLSIEGREADGSVTLFAKQHNGYMMGFGNPHGRFELGAGRKNPRFTGTTIPGAVHLDLNCDYLGMLNPKKLDWETDDYLAFVEQLVLGETPLLDSIHVIAHTGDLEHNKDDDCPLCSADGALNYSLACTSFMLFEPARMEGVCDGVHDGSRFLGLPLFRIMMYFIWRWGDMSTVLRLYWKHGEEVALNYLLNSDLPAKVGANTIDGVSAILRLIVNKFANGEKQADKDDGEPSTQDGQSSHGSPPPGPDKDDGEPSTQDGQSSHGPQPPGQHPPPPPGDDGEEEQGEQPPHTEVSGQTLVEIFAVLADSSIMNAIECIVVREGRGRSPHIIYMHSDKGKLEEGTDSDILEPLPFSGPTVAIPLQDGCSCSLEFFGYDNKAKDNILCLSDGCSYDEYQSKSMRYSGGILQVRYALLTSAVEANVSIGLELPLKINPDSRITGLITMSSSSLPNKKIVLFEVSDPEHTATPLPVGQRARFQKKLHLSPPTSLRLLRSCVVVKLASEVFFDGNLYIDGHQINISHKFLIPREVDVAKNVKSSWWKHGRSGIGYNINLNLINKPIC